MQRLRASREGQRERANEFGKGARKTFTPFVLQLWGGGSSRYHRERHRFAAPRFFCMLEIPILRTRFRARERANYLDRKGRGRGRIGEKKGGRGGRVQGSDLLEAEWRVVTCRDGTNLCDEWRDTTSFFVLKYVTDGVARATVHARMRLALGRGEKRIRAANIRAPTVAKRSGGRLKTGFIRRGRRLGSFYGLWFHS